MPVGTYELTIPGASEKAAATGDLDIWSELTLRGAGAAMNALVQTTSDESVEVIFAGGNAVIERLRVTGASIGLLNQGNLIVSDAGISENSSIGVVHAGELLLRRSAVINNSGGGLLNLVFGNNARVEGSTISGNTVSEGCLAPGIHSVGGRSLLDPAPIEVSNSTIADNHFVSPASCDYAAATFWDESSSIEGTLLDNPGLSNCAFPSYSPGYKVESDDRWDSRRAASPSSARSGTTAACPRREPLHQDRPFECHPPRAALDRCSAARPSVAWPAVKMCNGHDEDSLRLDVTEECVGKPWNEYAPEPTTKGPTTLRVLEHPLMNGLDRGDESEAEVLRLALVLSSGRDEFRLGFGMELDASHRSVERAFSKT